MVTRGGTSSIQTDHEALCDAAAGIRASLAGSCRTCGSETICACLRERFGEFHDRLLRHFDAEEALWRGIDRHAADWTTLHWIDALEREHQRFRRRAGELRLGLADPVPGPDLRAGLIAILDDLLEHELSESKLLQRAVFEGSPDIL